MSNELLLDPRAAKIRLEQTKESASLLSLARRSLRELNHDTSELSSLIKRLEPEIARLEVATQGHIEGRHRGAHVPRQPGVKAPEFLLFLDECGSHSPGKHDPKFPVFCLSGVVVPAADYDNFDVIWRAWKATNLGSTKAKVHEPDVRKGNRAFDVKGETARQGLLRSLERVLGQMDFQCIAAAVDLNAFVTQHGDDGVDEYLPRSCFLMCIDFVMERFLHYIHARDGSGKGIVIAESRGEREDAKVAAEFVRLQLEGTQFVSDSWFRYQLRPYIEFQGKHGHSSGLQIADLSARPFAERVLDPKIEPARWNVFKKKLYDGGKEAPFSYGLKVFPLTPENDPLPEFPKKAFGVTMKPPQTTD